ncbi:MAG: hypothetical protein DWQ06_13315 [Calditrichaeota bacterium]|nr:MAG: hypothetical protein DWQ06_13315 [Calditrichota bacterium]
MKRKDNFTQIQFFDSKLQLILMKFKKLTKLSINLNKVKSILLTKDLKKFLNFRTFLKDKREFHLKPKICNSKLWNSRFQ